MRPKFFFRHTIIYTLVGISNKALFLILWLTLGWLIAPEIIGQYTLVLFLVEFFSIVTLFGLDATLFRFYYHRDAPLLMSQIAGIFVISSLISLPFFLLITPFLKILLPETAAVLTDHAMLVGGLIISTALANLLLIYYTAAQQAKKYAVNLFLQSIIFASLSLILILMNFSLTGLLYAKLIANLVTLIFFLIQLKSQIKFRLPKFTWAPIKKILNYATPLMLQGSIGVISLYYGRLLLERYTSLQTFGIYSFFLFLTLQINQLWSFFNQAWTPKVFTELLAHDVNLDNETSLPQKIKLLTHSFIFLYLMAIIIFIVFGSWGLFPLIFKEIYQLKLTILYILLLSPLFSGLAIIAYPFYYYRTKTKKILYLSLLIVLVNFFLTFGLIRLAGETGAALGNVSISIIHLLVFLFVFRQETTLAPQLLKWSLLLTLIAVGAIAGLLGTGSWLVYVAILFSGVLLVYREGLLGREKKLISLTASVIKQFYVRKNK